MTKKVKQQTVFSQQIEEHIDVPFTVIGTPEWLQSSVETAGLMENQVIEVHSSGDLEESKRWLASRPILGLDSETGGENKRDGLDPVAETSRMLIFQLGTPDMVYLIEPALVPEYKEILESQDRIILTQNGVHDFKFLLAKYGIHFINYRYDSKTETFIPSVYDTMLAEQLLTAGLYGVSVGLEELAQKYPPHFLISKAVRREFIFLTGILEYRHLYYAARDVYLLFAIRKGQLVEINKHPDMWNRVLLEFSAMAGTADAELTGLNLDETRVHAALSYYQEKAMRIEKEITQLYNQKLKDAGIKRISILPMMAEHFDINSPSQKLKVLKELGFDVKNTQRETLLALGDKLTDLLGEYTECTKVISTYGEGLLNRRSKTTGKLHPEFNQLGSGDLERSKGADKATTIATGRWSSDAQQFPRPEHTTVEITDPERVNHLKSLFSEQYQQAIEVFKTPKEEKK